MIEQPLLAQRFNQDCSCVAVGTRRGYQVFTCEPFASCHASADGGVGLVEMLFSSSLIALVGAGARPGDSPRRLRLWNTRANSLICELNFSSAVLALRMNRSRLVAALERLVHVFELSSMKLLHTLESAPNPRGLVDLCADSSVCHCALPASAAGQVLLFDALDLHALSTVDAHKGALACIALSTCGRLMATASEKGTVVRVHAFPQGQLLHTFRRGSLPASISSLAFSPGVMVADRYQHAGSLLCAASSTGTVHVWSLEAQRGAVQAVSAGGKQGGAVQLPIFSGERDFAHAKLRTPPGARAIAAIADSQVEGHAEQIKHTLYVLTDNGMWYSYRLDALSGGECVLQDERRVTPDM